MTTTLGDAVQRYLAVERLIQELEEEKVSLKERITSAMSVGDVVELSPGHLTTVARRATGNGGTSSVLETDDVKVIMTVPMGAGGIDSEKLRKSLGGPRFVKLCTSQRFDPALVLDNIASGLITPRVAEKARINPSPGKPRLRVVGK